MMETVLTDVVSVRERTLGDRLAAAATRLYDAEIALHIARQTAVDDWVAAAYRRLHAAVCEHRAALFATGMSVEDRSCGHQRRAS